MEYTIKRMADLAGISTRTLRYYDEIGLLSPKEVSESGYRIYGERQVDALQQILFYKEMGLELAEIKKAMDDPETCKIKALQGQLATLRKQQHQLNLLINNVEKTIKREKGLIKMSDKEKFEGLKKQLVDDNMEQYGDEIVEKYGKETVDASNAKMMGLSQQEYEKMTQLSQTINKALEDAVTNAENPKEAEGQKIAEMHKTWLGFTWPSYSKEAHAGLAEMYIADERFRKYYDGKVEGCAQFLRDAIKAYTA